MRTRSVPTLLAIIVVLLAVSPVAWANRNVKKLIADLTESDDKKVRLSAANSLAKIGADDEDAIEAFIGVLVGNDDYKKDSDKSVRATAAAGLGKVVTADTDPDLRDEAIAALGKAYGSSKENKFVKKQAKKALDKLKKLEGGDDDGGGGGGDLDGIYVDIGKMASETGDEAAIKSAMKTAMERTLKNKASSWDRGSGKKAPKDKHGFHVDGTLNTVSFKNGNLVCKISMVLASYTYPDKKSIFGLLDGKGAVPADQNDEDDVAQATLMCVDAVVEDITIKKIIPTIKSKAGS